MAVAERRVRFLPARARAMANATNRPWVNRAGRETFMKRVHDNWVIFILRDISPHFRI